MARISSKAKAGFYPTPDEVTRILQSKFHFGNDARLFDPCCGEGKTLSAIAKGHQVETYGIELDYDRVKEARTRLNIVRWADSITEMKITRGVFGMLFLNPPYDYESNPEGKAERLERVFLKRFANSLQKGGWLVFVIPYYVLVDCADVLARCFTDIGIYAFPESEFWTFKQCIVVGERNLVSQDDKQESQDELRFFGSVSPERFLEAMPTLEQLPVLSIPAPACDINTFHSSRLDPEEAIALAMKGGLLKQVVKELTVRSRNAIRPVAPLEVGHLSLMLASGYMNGLLERDGKRLIIKGIVEKDEVFLESSSTEDKAVYQDVYKPTVKAIDLVEGEMLVIQ